MSNRPAYQDWKKVKFRKQENKVRGEHDFSIRLEATLHVYDAGTWISAPSPRRSNSSSHA